MPVFEMTWHILRIVLIWVASLLIVCGMVVVGVTKVQSQFFAPVDKTDNTTVKISIARGSSVSTIGRELAKANLIRNKGVFQYYVEFSGMSGKLKAGTYELKRNMTVKDIMTELSMGDGGQQITTFKLIEGMNIEEMAQSLVKQNVLTQTKVFLDLCTTGEAFVDFDFVQQVVDKKQKDRRYVLEGYLFPDTYEIYVGANEETILRKMLSRTREVYNVNYVDQAEREGVSMDEVLTLAAMIEKEAKTQDFAKVSAVFHNRLDKKQGLESCVTVQYALKIKRLILTADDLSVSSPYNTYRNKGLPLGPVANPGKNAIEAALYPDETFVKEGYLYFCSKDPETGELQFSKTLKEHEAASKEYRPLWQLFDDKNKGK